MRRKIKIPWEISRVTLEVMSLKVRNNRLPHCPLSNRNSFLYELLSLPRYYSLSKRDSFLYELLSLGKRNSFLCDLLVSWQAKLLPI